MNNILQPEIQDVSERMCADCNAHTCAGRPVYQMEKSAAELAALLDSHKKLESELAFQEGQLSYIRSQNEDLTDRLAQAERERDALKSGILTCLKCPRGSEAQIRCLEEIGQDAAALKGKQP